MDGYIPTVYQLGETNCFALLAPESERCDRPPSCESSGLATGFVADPVMRFKKLTGGSTR